MGVDWSARGEFREVERWELIGERGEWGLLNMYLKKRQCLGFLRKKRGEVFDETHGFIRKLGIHHRRHERLESNKFIAENRGIK